MEGHFLTVVGEWTRLGRVARYHFEGEHCHWEPKAPLKQARLQHYLRPLEVVHSLPKVSTAIQLSRSNSTPLRPQ